MRIVTASNGKKTVKMSKSEWTEIGKKAGWTKVANMNDDFDRNGNPSANLGLDKVEESNVEESNVGSVETPEEIVAIMENWSNKNKPAFDELAKEISRFPREVKIAVEHWLVDNFRNSIYSVTGQ